MTSHRSERVGERIHQEISLMLQRDMRDPRLTNVNVTHVEVSGDLRHAKVFVTARGEEAGDRELLDALAHAAGYFRRRLAASLDLRFAPDIRFQLDRSIEAGERFLEILDQVQSEDRVAARGRKEADR